MSRRVGVLASAVVLAGAIGVVFQAAPAFAANPPSSVTVTYDTGTTTCPTGTTAGQCTQFDGDIVTIPAQPAGTWDNSTTLEVLECTGTLSATPSSNTACEGNTLNVSTHSTSTGASPAISFRTYSLGVPGFLYAVSTHNIDASESGGTLADPGVLYIGENENNFSQPHTFANITIGVYGRLVGQVATTKPLPGGGAPGTATVNAAAGAVADDSSLAAVTIGGYAETTPPAPVQGTATCTAAGACTYTSNATYTATPTSDTFGVTATGSDTTYPSVFIPTATETVNLDFPQAPTLNPTPNPATLTSDASGTTVTVNPQATATDSAGNPETVTAVTPGSGSPDTTTYGSVSCAAATPFTCTYTLGASAPAAGGTDTFTLTATAGGLTSAPVTVTVDIPPAFPPACNAVNGASGTPPTNCSLYQIVNIPVTAGDLTMGQSNGLPTDTLGATVNSAGACSGPAITLNGEPQYACGDMAPITVVNARGTDAGWDLTGQVTDFIDSGKVTNTSLLPEGFTPAGTLDSSCDTVATYNNHCIPGDNAGWVPAAAVASNIVPGDVAEVLPGTNVTAPGFTAPLTATGVLAGNCGVYVFGENAGTYYTTPNSLSAPADAACSVQPSVATYPNYPVGPAGLHTAAHTLCSSSESTGLTPGEQSMPAGHAGGTFVCGAELIVAVPASAAAPTVASSYGTGYQAFLTLTLA